MGLTATPVRYFDDIGTNFVFDFLGNTIYSFSIKQAQKEGFLCQYRYHISFVDINKQELEKYLQLTKLIAMNHNKDEEKTTKLLFKRAKLIKDANSKYSEFEKLVKNLKKEFQLCLIYTDEDQLPTIRMVLKKFDVMYGEFLGKTVDNERKELILKIESRMIDAIVAIKCLNEGIDIPPLRLGIFLSSSKNSREFIQRRGRLLRTYEAKGVVDIYDIIVAPDPRI